MTLPDPARSGWRLWVIVCVLLISVPAACTMTTQASPAPSTMVAGEVQCDGALCLVQQATMEWLLNALRGLIAELEGMRARGCK